MQRLSLLRVIKVLFSYCGMATVDTSSLWAVMKAAKRSQVLPGFRAAAVEWLERAKVWRLIIPANCIILEIDKRIPLFLHTAKISFSSRLVGHWLLSTNQQYFLKSSLLLCVLVKPSDTKLWGLTTSIFLLQRWSVQGALLISSSGLIFFVTVLHCGMLMQECASNMGWAVRFFTFCFKIVCGVTSHSLWPCYGDL